MLNEKRHMRKRAFELMTLAFVASLAIVARPLLATSGDVVIQYPQGWKAGADIPPYSASATRSAIAAYKYRSDDPANVFDQSLVLQAGSEDTTSTQFFGKVFDLAYSPRGEGLLVHRVGGSDLLPGELGVHLVDPDGRIVWSQTSDSRMFFFSMTGEVIYAWDPGDTNPADGGRAVELFDLEGRSLNKKVDLDTAVVAALVPDAGQSVIFVTPRAVTRLDVGPPISVAWKIDLPPGSPDAVGAHALDSERFVVELDRGARWVVHTSGKKERAIGAGAMDLGKGRKLDRAARYGIFAGPSGRLVLFDGARGSHPRSLDTLETVPIDTDEPGYAIGNRIAGQRVFLFSEQDVRVRVLP